jgi:hypothetical protein
MQTQRISLSSISDLPLPPPPEFLFQPAFSAAPAASVATAQRRLPDSLPLPRVAGSAGFDATPEHRIVAGLVFQPRRGQARADVRPGLMHGLVLRAGWGLRYAVASPARRAGMRCDRLIQEINGEIGSLLEKLAQPGTGKQAWPRLRGSLETLQGLQDRFGNLHPRAVAGRPPGRVLGAVARAQIGMLDIDALYALRTGLLRKDPNGMEHLLSSIRCPGDRSDGRRILHTLREAVNAACACVTVQGPLLALARMPDESCQAQHADLPQVTQIDSRLRSLNDHMNLRRSARIRKGRAPIADVQHGMRVEFLAPAASRLTTGELCRLQGMLERREAMGMRHGLPWAPPVPASVSSGDEVSDDEAIYATIDDQDAAPSRFAPVPAGVAARGNEAAYEMVAPLTSDLADTARALKAAVMAQLAARRPAG